MCGRFTLSVPAAVLAELFQLADAPAWSPRYPIAPTHPAPTVAMLSGQAGRPFRLFHWDLIPSWGKEASIGTRMINAQAATAAAKPPFRTAFRQRRCLVRADGFYEWQREARREQPFYIRLRDGRPFAFAGRWERWEFPKGEGIHSCTLLTTETDDLIRRFHHRMPVIL